MRRLKRIAEHEWCFDWPGAFLEEYELIDAAMERFNAGQQGAAEQALRAVLGRLPDHLDARWQLASFLFHRGQRAEAVVLWRGGVTLGHTAFPPRAFRVGRDVLEWGWPENRPFLRCLASWMQVRAEAGAHGEALECARELLALNPRDNQGVRCVAMTWLLERGGNEEAAALAAAYPDDGFAETTYGRALALFRLGRAQSADEVLRKAVAGLPRVGAELLKAAHRRPRGRPTGRLTIGGREQAYEYWRCAGSLWARTAGALDWLGQVRNAVQGDGRDPTPEAGG